MRAFRPSSYPAIRLKGPTLQGKVAVITGASRGIGQAIGWELARAGARVVLTGRDEQLIGELAGRMRRDGFDALAVPLDVRDEASVRAAFDRVGQDYGRLDFLVNNAGIAHKLSPVQDLDPGTWREVIETNLSGLFLCTRYALPRMPDGASIVNNLSVAAQGMWPGHAGYNASKWGGLGLTNTLREELRPRRIRVIALLPGPTDTAIWEQFMPERTRSKMMAPETIARAIVDCLALPENAVVEEIRIRPVTGAI
ncbi:MAG: SDR family NAD(P)-dependent oxidoreductase [Acidobacteria bacterium]|nr:SDR family NAD(P)-dependent oxidoreductase [Acidobacteriota bacterium]